MQTQDIDYRADAVICAAISPSTKPSPGRGPGVLVFHEGLGLGEFAMARARMLAELGYVAFAADMFGDRRQARNLQEVAKLVGDLRSEPETLRGRGRAALAALAALPQVDAEQDGGDRFLLWRLGGAGARARGRRSQGRRQFSRRAHHQNAGGSRAG